MILANIAFYVFATLLVLSAFCVISVKNPVHAILFLIFAFFNAAGLFVLLGAEFLAMLMVIVYVGAVAVLFLFVIMMLNINFAELKEGFLRNLPLASVIAVLLLIELIFIIRISYYSLNTIPVEVYDRVSNELTNTESLGLLLYTHYVYIFQVAGLILLVAMVGAMLLTHRKRAGVKKQNITAQVFREKEKSIKIVKVKVGKGI